MQYYVSHDLLTELLEQSEEAIDWQETQQSLINDVGVENYLQTHIDGD